jgi:hypothetical protein
MSNGSAAIVQKLWNYSNPSEFLRKVNLKCISRFE